MELKGGLSLLRKAVLFMRGIRWRNYTGVYFTESFSHNYAWARFNDI